MKTIPVDAYWLERLLQASASVNYEGKETPVRAYYAKPSDREFRPGTYFIDIYEQGGKLIGQTSVDLR